MGISVGISAIHAADRVSAGCGTAPSVVRSCAPEWQYWRGACYRLIPPVTWNGGVVACQEMGGEMVAPRSMEENEFLVKTARSERSLKDSPLWIGCNDQAKEGTWVCEGQGANGPLYLNWRASNPDNQYGEQHCAAIFMTDGKWNDRRCRIRQRAICVRRDPFTCRPHNAPRYCHSTADNGTFNTACLSGQVTTEFVTGSVVACGSACIAEPACCSFNVMNTDDGKKFCQLVADCQSKDKLQTTAEFCMYSGICVD